MKDRKSDNMRIFRWFHLNGIYGCKTDVVKQFQQSNVLVLKIKDIFKCGGRKLED